MITRWQTDKYYNIRTNVCNYYVNEDVLIYKSKLNLLAKTNWQKKIFFRCGIPEINSSCLVVPGDTSAPFPDCCDKIECSQMLKEKLFPSRPNRVTLPTSAPNPYENLVTPPNSVTNPNIPMIPLDLIMKDW